MKKSLFIIVIFSSSIFGMESGGNDNGKPKFWSWKAHHGRMKKLKNFFTPLVQNGNNNNVLNGAPNGVNSSFSNPSTSPQGEPGQPFPSNLPHHSEGKQEEDSGREQNQSTPLVVPVQDNSQKTWPMWVKIGGPTGIVVIGAAISLYIYKKYYVSKEEPLEENDAEFAKDSKKK